MPEILFGSCVVVTTMWFGYRHLFKARMAAFERTTARMSFASPLPDDVTVTVIIPAYNEEANVVDCVSAIINGSSLTSKHLTVIVVDDGSKDQTLPLIRDYQDKLEGDQKEILVIMEAGPRPEGELWVGKNWAVWQAAQTTTTTYVVFVDADVRLKPGGLELGLAVAHSEGADLLSGDVAFKCGCFAEKLVQPVILQNLVLSNNHDVANDDESTVAAGAGHIMIFNREMYMAFEGHKTVHDEVVEDVMIAFLFKTRFNRRVLYFDFTRVAEITMYTSWSDMHEGYTKNIFLAFDQNVPLILTLSVANIIMFTLPPFQLAGGIYQIAHSGVNLYNVSTAVLATACIGQQYLIRSELEKKGRISTEAWYLQPVGGVLTGYLATASMVKSLTGMKWTWKGRDLKMPKGRKQ